jgi:long-chain acyl-CoA synthetase
MAVTNLGSAVGGSVDPATVAVIDLGGAAPRLFSYGDVQRFSDAFARGLLRRGLRRGDRVAILAANCAEYLVAFLGTMRAGLVSVPVNHRLPAATVNFIIEDADAQLVLCDAARLGLLRAKVPRVVIEEEYAGLLDEGDFVPTDAADGEPAMFLYTSGSTGRPKRGWCYRTRAISGCWRCALTLLCRLPSVCWLPHRCIT